MYHDSVFHVPKPDGRFKQINVRIETPPVISGGQADIFFATISNPRIDPLMRFNYVVRGETAPSVIPGPQMLIAQARITFLEHLARTKPDYITYPLAIKTADTGKYMNMTLMPHYIPLSADNLRFFRLAIKDLPPKARDLLIAGILISVLRPIRELQNHASHFTFSEDGVVKKAEYLVHCDLKIGNILADYHKRQLRICDFGLLAGLSQGRFDVVIPSASGTLPFVSPEHRERRISRTSDIYVAVLVVVDVMTGIGPVVAGQEPLDVLSISNSNLRSIVSNMLSEDPRSRPLPDEALDKLTHLQGFEKAEEAFWLTFRPALVPSTMAPPGDLSTLPLGSEEDIPDYPSFHHQIAGMMSTAQEVRGKTQASASSGGASHSIPPIPIAAAAASASDSDKYEAVRARFPPGAMHNASYQNLDKAIRELYASRMGALESPADVADEIRRRYDARSAPNMNARRIQLTDEDLTEFFSLSPEETSKIFESVITQGVRSGAVVATGIVLDRKISAADLTRFVRTACKIAWAVGVL